MTDAREESSSPTHDTVALDERQRQLVDALYEAYRRDLHGLKNKPLDESDWEGVVCDEATAYAVQDADMARKRGMHVSVGTVFVPPAFEAGEWRVEFSGPFGTLEVTAK